MSATLSLVKRADLGADSASLSLLDYTDGIALAADGWIVGVADDSGQRLVEPVVETMTLRFSGSSQDDLASDVRNLDSFLRQIRLYRDDATDTRGLWLRAKLENETNARQAFVIDSKSVPRTPIGGALAGNRIREYGLAITRLPYWEASGSTTFTVSGIGATGGASALSASIPGDWPSRVARMKVSGAGSGANCTEVFVAFRSDKFGAASEFNPLIEAESGTPGVDTSVSSTASTDSGGQTMRTGFSSGNDDNQRRITLTAGDHFTASVYRGEFEVLARMYVTGCTLARAQLRHGFANDVGSAALETVDVSSSNARFYPMGRIQWPVVNRSGTIFGSSLHLYATRYSGSTGGLHVDCFVLLPFDESEGFAHFNGALISQSSSYASYLYTLPGDDVHGETVDETTTGEVIARFDPSGTTAQNWHVPTGCNVRMIVVAQDNDTALGGTPSHSISTKLNVTLDFYPRFRTLRGSA